MGRDVFEEDVFAHSQPTTVYLQILDNTTFTATQSCDSALKILLEEHGGGYDHSFGHRGVLGAPPRPSCTPAPRAP